MKNSVDRVKEQDGKAGLILNIQKMKILGSSPIASWQLEGKKWKKTLESPLDNKEINPVNPKGYQPWIFIGRTDVEAKTPIFCPLGMKSWLIGKHSDAGKDWVQEEKWAIEDEMFE